jgi:lipopolysaccharide/colanic/teichoic acid biosynthesis glycosyltransferase
MNSQNISLNWALGSRTAPVPIWKRVLDLALIVILSPLLVFFGLLVSVLVKASSPGPVLFRQQRIGYKGREFTCFKFRTMHVNSGDDSHAHHTTQLIRSEQPMIKLDEFNDPRLVPIGSALRASGLDELPQLLNVLRGDMSIVGPRPCMPYEYESHEPWQRRRFNAVPGLTGLWQVSGKNRTTFTQMVQLDIKYAERQSLWLDLKIIAKTFPTLLRQCFEVRAAKRKQAAASSQQTGKPVQLNTL